jgi:hypothetical protein
MHGCRFRPRSPDCVPGRRTLIAGALAGCLLAACGGAAPGDAGAAVARPASTGALSSVPPDLAPEVRTAVLAALEAERQAKRIADTATGQRAIADDIYEGPAVMAIWRGESASGPYQGLGVLELPDSGITYAGRFRDGLLDGPGVWRDVEERLLFAGTFMAGDKEGPGAEYGPGGEVIAAGDWKQNSLGY